MFFPKKKKNIERKERFKRPRNYFVNVDNLKEIGIHKTLVYVCVCVFFGGQNKRNDLNFKEIGRNISRQKINWRDPWITVKNIRNNFELC